MTLNVPEPVSKLLQRFEAAGFEACLVGGCVRDSLRGVQPQDYDVATAALPEQTKMISDGYRVIETGLKHGTVTVIAGDYPVEITTYRTESGYSDHRHPDSVSYTPLLTEDLARRDFTVNAMAYIPGKGLIDPFGGENDLNNKLLRCVGVPENRFSEDALRILRAVRFSSTLGFSVEENTAAAAFSARKELRFVSSERISAEFSKLICGDFAVRAITDFGDIIREFISVPETVTDSAVLSLNKLKKSVPLRLAALLSDLPAEQAGGQLRRLRYSNFIRERAVKLIAAHRNGIPSEYADICSALDKLTPELFFEYIELERALWAVSEDFDSLCAAETAEKTACRILENNECYSLKQLDVSGSDIAAAGISSGREIGAALNNLLSAVIAGKVANKKQLLMEYLTKKLSCADE